MNIEKIKNIIPLNVYNELPSIIDKLDTPLKLAHFLSQTAHESNNFKSVIENLNYSALRLNQIFPKYFKDVNPKNYANSPEKIANRVYASRMGNGDEKSGDGYKYRGRGYIQLTGKSNYSSFDKEVEEDILANPDLVATKYPLKSAAWFFTSRKLDDKAIDDSDKTIKTITLLINGGTIGLDERFELFHKFYDLLK